jgi:hypothetical protein
MRISLKYLYSLIRSSFHRVRSNEIRETHHRDNSLKKTCFRHDDKCKLNKSITVSLKLGLDFAYNNEMSTANSNK